MAGLADDWKVNRQICIDVLCAYLRMPYEPDPGEDAPGEDGPIEKRLAFQASREVRHTVIRVITNHLNGTAPVSWRGLNFDFTGVVFDGGTFTRAEFSGGTVDFTFAGFSGGTVGFGGAEFSAGTVDFGSAGFSGGTVDFSDSSDWSQPPAFGRGVDESGPPPGVTLPAAKGPSPGTSPSADLTGNTTYSSVASCRAHGLATRVRPS